MASNGGKFDLLNGIDPPAQLLIKLFLDMLLHQVFERKDFPGFSVFWKAPPGYPEHTALLEFCILQTTVRWMRDRSLLSQRTMCEPRVITNLASVAIYLAEAMLEGSFEGYADLVLDFAGSALEYYQKPEIAMVKTVRLCSQSIITIKWIMLEAVLLQLSKTDETSDGEKILGFLKKMLYWQQVIFEAEEVKPDFLRLFSYQLHLKLEDPRKNVRMAAASFWRIMLMQKPAAMARILDLDMSSAEKDLLSGFERLRELDDDAFLAWRAEHRRGLDAAFTNTFATAWDRFIAAIHKKGETIAKARGDQRKEKLKQWAMDEATLERTLHQHEAACHHMAVNIYAAERLKHQRTLQDNQDNTSFLLSSLKKLESNLKGPSGLISHDSQTKWRLDQTEGRNRMRIRMIPDVTDKKHGPETKRPRSQSQPEPNLKPPSPARPASHVSVSAPESGLQPLRRTPTGRTTRSGDEQQTADSPGAELDDEFEMVDDPREDGDGYEDKNRTVIRSLQRGDQIQHVYNVSRIIGLEACEGLLILGKGYLYLLDGVFQRSDGEIVGVSQAPKDERDPYLQLISGRQTDEERQPKTAFQRDSRQWKWGDLVSISKRRFLFRDVAIEVFFTDGRSYLLTSMSPEIRNELFHKLTESAPHISGSSTSRSPEDLWRLETLTCLDEHSHSFGSKLANVFQSGYPYAATRKWARGEISNFHYLMLVNTMAGRTFNDLTQYPVFPWVLADYTSDELDLTNPDTFRDLSKPMGAQNPLRESEFQSRYRTFAELEDHNAPPFHYGTHYSSAMIVTSYLVRLQPFVQSFLLLQGGNFDHADRMFHSIEQAWTSASRAHMTDVRELIPEFFYLPEFLENTNGYNFGVLQKNGKSIDSVTLPLWAKGDPKIFIAKHREALESPYVRQHLAYWIDLVFGWRQQGEAAVKATNVFHHLSYHGAKDLDTIEDPVERVATIGIIHNFGQTPHQVFQKPHPLPETTPHKRRRLDSAVEGLTRLPTPLLGKEYVADCTVTDCLLADDFK